jgi:hypothetical protein
MKILDYILAALAVVVLFTLKFSSLFQNAEVGDGISIIASAVMLVGVVVAAMKLETGKWSARAFRGVATGCILAFASVSAYAANLQVNNTGTFLFRWSSTSYAQHPFFAVRGRDNTNGFGVDSNGLVRVTTSAGSNFFARRFGNVMVWTNE